MTWSYSYNSLPLPSKCMCIKCSGLLSRCEHSWLRYHRKASRTVLRMRLTPTAVPHPRRQSGLVKASQETLLHNEAQFTGGLQGLIHLWLLFLSCFLNSAPAVFLCPISLINIFRNGWSIWVRMHMVTGIDGQVDTRLICGIRIAGMNHRTRKDDKVLELWLIDILLCLLFFFSCDLFHLIYLIYFHPSYIVLLADGDGKQLPAVYLGMI